VRTFADTVIVKAGLGPVYDFLYRVQDWPQRLPHVERVILDEAVPNVQSVEMDTMAADGSPFTTRMVRVCSPYHSIMYKQTEPPDLLSAHIGGWHLFPTADGVRVTAHNTVMIHPDTLQAPAPNVGVGRAGELVRQTLRKHCLATLAHVKYAAEGQLDWPALRAAPTASALPVELPVD
jgi:aromatase